jgi:NADH-quinone oxidoreductase subunit N
MMTEMTQMGPVLPELMLLFGVIVTMMVRLFSREGAYDRVYASCQATLMLTVGTLAFAVEYVPLGISFSGLWILDFLALFSKGIILIGAYVVFAYGKDYVASLEENRLDYYLLALLSVLGMMVLVSASHMLTVYLGIELLALPIYAMIALWRTQNSCVEAALKYFITGAIASCLLLYGFSLLYGATGLLSYADIRVFLLLQDMSHNPMMLIAVAFILAGLAFKLGAVPFHMWAPDVYEGAPLPVTLFIASLPKLAMVVVLLRTFGFMLAPLALIWTKGCLVLALASIIVGNIAAMQQQNIKRLLAYSSIAHMGYVLLGIVVHSVIGYSAMLFYIMVYILGNLAIFGALLSMEHKRQYPQAITDLRGLHTVSRAWALIVLLALFSMAGVPPIVGFMAKMWVFSLLIQQHMVPVAVVAVLFTVLGAYYYIRVIRVMYFEAPSQPIASRLVVRPAVRIMLFANGALLLYYGMFPAGLFTLCRYLTIAL